MGANKLISSNKKARYDYTLSDDLEVGLMLVQSEIKDLTSNGINLKESYVKIISGEVFLLNANISGNTTIAANPEDFQRRPRKLLLHKKQIRKYEKLLQDPGTTLIIKDVYLNDRGIAKATLCLATGKKKYDKRKAIKERDLKRDIKNNI